MSNITDRITEYLSSGGLFNPELAEHDVVRDLLIDCRDTLKKLKNFNEELQSQTYLADIVIERLKKENERLRGLYDYLATELHKAAEERDKWEADYYELLKQI
jgi:hypothetical protein